MTRVPEFMPDDLPVQTVDGLVKTITGICNESAITRAEILGALETAKFSLMHSWRVDAEGDD